MGFDGSMVVAPNLIKAPFDPVRDFAPTVQKLRVHYAKRGRLRFSSHRDFQRALERALRRAQVPMAEMLTYEQHLTSATGGRGSYHMEYSHYDEVPHQAQAKIIAASKAAKGHEVEEEV